MLKLTLVLMLLSAVPVCNRCLDDQGCADSFAFRIVDKTNGQDLVFSPTPVYHPDSVYLTTRLTGYGGRMSYTDNGKIRSALLSPVATFFLHFSATDSDTLLMRYDFVEAKCCASKHYGKITGIQYNGVPAQKSGDLFVFEK